MKKGFTLIELLIAAALVAVLTVAATRTFRSMQHDIRKENAKHGAMAVAAAAYRFQIEYPNATFQTNTLSNPTRWRNQNNCIPTNVIGIQELVDCNFLEARAYIPYGFDFKFSGASDPSIEVTSDGISVFSSIEYDAQ